MVNLAMPLAILCGALAVGLSGLMAGFAIWAGAHLVANGDLAHAILFGGMLIFALAGLARSGVPRSFRPTPLRLLLAVALWIALIALHPLIVGVSPLPSDPMAWFTADGTPAESGRDPAESDRPSPARSSAPFRTRS